MNPDLGKFLEHARERGMDPATIRMLLLSSGWKEKDVAQALARHSLDLPVPLPPDAGGARDAFLHLTAFAALYAAAIACVALLFAYISLLLPDPAFALEGRDVVESLQGVRWSMAVLLVAFPTYLFTSRLLLKEIRAQVEKSWSGVRRWLTYLTLFVAFLALGTDFVTLVFFFLEGELSARFLLKVACVAVVAGMILFYYFRTVRMPAATLATSRMHRGFAGVSTLLAAAVLVWGSIVAGSPAQERLRKLDEQRIEDLQAISDAIERHCLGPEDTRPDGAPFMRNPLPPTLEPISAETTSRRLATADPVSGRPYSYRPTGVSTYELCAAFDSIRDASYETDWNHAAGEHCFSRDVLKVH